MALGLNEIKGLADPFKNFNYEFIIPNMPGGGDGEILKISAVTVSIPGFMTEPIEETFPGGHMIKHAGKGTYNREIAVEFREGQDLAIFTALNGWYDLIWNRETGAQTVADSYKTEAILHMLDSAKETVRTVRMRGVFIQSVDDLSMDSAGGEGVRISANFSYDDWIYE